MCIIFDGCSFLLISPATVLYCTCTSTLYARSPLMLRIASTYTAAAGLFVLLWAIGLVVLTATWSSSKDDEWFAKTDRGEAAPQAVIGLAFFSIVVWVRALLTARCSPHSNSNSLLYNTLNSAHYCIRVCPVTLLPSYSVLCRRASRTSRSSASGRASRPRSRRPAWIQTRRLLQLPALQLWARGAPARRATSRPLTEPLVATERSNCLPELLKPPDPQSTSRQPVAITCIHGVVKVSCTMLSQSRFPSFLPDAHIDQNSCS